MGRNPPTILDEGEAVRVTLRASEISVPFRMFVAEEGDRGYILSVEDLLIIQHFAGTSRDRHAHCRTHHAGNRVGRTRDLEPYGDCAQLPGARRYRSWHLLGHCSPNSADDSPDRGTLSATTALIGMPPRRGC